MSGKNFYTDPLNVPDLEAYVLRLLQETIKPEPCGRAFPQHTRELHGLERLPTEMLEHISAYLPACSALALHKTSRALASKVPLDNNYWRDGILNRTALPYLRGFDVE
jgi:hypothetical protein